MHTGVDVKKNVVVSVSSDKGLCGGINSTVVKISRALHKLTAGKCYFRIAFCSDSVRVFSYVTLLGI